MRWQEGWWWWWLVVVPMAAGGGPLPLLCRRCRHSRPLRPPALAASQEACAVLPHPATRARTHACIHDARTPTSHAGEVLAAEHLTDLHAPLPPAHPPTSRRKGDGG